MPKTKPPQTRKKAAQQKKRPIGPLLIALGGLLLLGALAWSFWPSAKISASKAQVTGAAALRSDKEKIDLGDVRLGNTVSASFQLTNVGDQPLHFTKAPYIQVVEGC